uniref:Uncharacterized protein n=1 Tax=Brassica oleracea var. oleracea TaxID=109376 RepID=A0A0D3CGB9_BRAOL
MNSNDGTVATALEQRHCSIDRHSSKEIDRHCKRKRSEEDEFARDLTMAA